MLGLSCGMRDLRWGLLSSCSVWASLVMACELQSVQAQWLEHAGSLVVMHGL